MAVGLAACSGDDPSDKPGSSSGASSGTEWAEPAMRRLTASQYINGVADVFGKDVALSGSLEADESNELFLTMGAAKVGTSERGVEQYHEAAIELATQIVAQAEAHPPLADCAPFVPGDPCVAEAIEYYGRRLWRRPLTAEEINRAVAVQEAAPDVAEEDHAVGMSYALASLLASPHYIYLIEVGEPAPGSSLWRYTAYEMASRLSYFLWNSVPDEQLLSAAERGELNSPDGIRTQAERMLELGRAEDLATRFFGESWGVASLNVTDKNIAVFPEWTQERVDAYKQEFALFLRDLTHNRNGDLRELLTAEKSFVNGTLAEVYGLDVSGEDYREVDLPGVRSGLLTSPAVVAAVSPSDRTSPTLRGVFVLERLLCTEVSPPPPDVDDTLDPPSVDEGMTLKEKLAAHRTNPVCASCHDAMDGLGFPLEHFDAVGRYRTTEVDLPIDATGELKGESIDGSDELAAAILNEPEFTSCIAERLFAYSTGHEAIKDERVQLESMTQSLRGHHRFRALVLEIVTSDAFRYLASPK